MRYLIIALFLFINSSSVFGGHIPAIVVHNSKPQLAYALPQSQDVGIYVIVDQKRRGQFLTLTRKSDDFQFQVINASRLKKPKLPQGFTFAFIPLQNFLTAISQFTPRFDDQVVFYSKGQRCEANKITFTAEQIVPLYQEFCSLVHDIGKVVTTKFSFLVSFSVSREGIACINQLLFDSQLRAMTQEKGVKKPFYHMTLGHIDVPLEKWIDLTFKLYVQKIMGEIRESLEENTFTFNEITRLGQSIALVPTVKNQFFLKKIIEKLSSYKELGFVVDRKKHIRFSPHVSLVRFTTQAEQRLQHDLLQGLRAKMNSISLSELDLSFDKLQVKTSHFNLPFLGLREVDAYPEFTLPLSVGQVP